MKNVTSDEIKSLIEIFDDSEWRELALQVGDFRIFLSRDPNGADAPWSSEVSATIISPEAAPKPAGGRVTAAHEPSPATATDSKPDVAGAQDEVPDHYVVVRAPTIGIFYLAPTPGAASYVEIGETVDTDTEICLIEVMKLFTSVHAGIRGIVRQVCIQDGAMVEYNTPLFYIEPVE